MTDHNIKLNSAKAWVALAFLIITGIENSDVMPITGSWHTVMVIVTIVVGALSTWIMPANPQVVNNGG